MTFSNNSRCIVTGAAGFIGANIIKGLNARAQSLADALSVNVALIYSAALCTGLARLQGSTARLTGPFSF